MAGNGEGPVVGIDLGTSYARMAVWVDDNVKIINNDHKNPMTPSYVAFTNMGRLIGDAAKTQAHLNSADTVFDAKRLIGRKFSDASVQRDMKLWPFKVIPGPDDKPMVAVKCKSKEKHLSAEEIYSTILTRMKENAEACLSKPIKNAVVTVGTHFNHFQRQAIRDACAISGLNVMRIVNEATAAGITYGILGKTRTSDEENVLIFNLGGGTLDVSLLTIENDVLETKATAGDPHLGGEDFINRMMDWLIPKLETKTGKDITKNPRALLKLRTTCEQAKRTLSWSYKTMIKIYYLEEGIDFRIVMTRARFEELNMDLFRRCMEPIKKCLRDAKMHKSNIHDVVLVGGSSQIPKVRELLQDFFNRKELCMCRSPDEAVVYGAAIQAAVLSGEGGGKTPDLLLLDSTPLSLGIETADGVRKVLIPRNSTIPVIREAAFTMRSDDPSAVSFKVYEGKGTLTRHNTLIGEYDFTGLPPAPRGDREINICLNVDVNAVLTVSAQDIATGLKKTLMSKEEERKKKALEKYASDMRKYAEEMMAEAKKIEEAAQSACRWLEDNRLPKAEEVYEKMKALEAMCDPIVAKMGPGSSGGPSAMDEDGPSGGASSGSPKLLQFF